MAKPPYEWPEVSDIKALNYLGGKSGGNGNIRGIDQCPRGAFGVSALSLTSALGLHQEPEHHPEGREDTRTGMASGRSHAQKNLLDFCHLLRKEFPNSYRCQEEFPNSSFSISRCPLMAGQGHRSLRGTRRLEGSIGGWMLPGPGVTQERPPPPAAT